MRVRSNEAISPSFDSFNGVPQGDPLSPLLFSLFTADLPAALTHTGVEIDNKKEIKYLLYADDLVLLTTNPNQLQLAINQLQVYANQSHLTVNTSKTKCMVFHAGACRRSTFYFNGTPLENVNTFTYLGVVFSTRLSAHKHVLHIISKCNSRVGLLFSRLPLKELPLTTVLHVFNIYILPILTYCSTVWLPWLKSKADINRMNASFTKFLKRYLGVPYRTHNSIVHFITNTIPLNKTLKEKAQNLFLKVQFPRSLEGVQFTPPVMTDEYQAFKELPSTFWASEVLSGELPRGQESRRALMYDLIDLYHTHICIFEDMVGHPQGLCICKLCDNLIEGRYHYRTCPILSHLTPCARMRKLKLI